MLKPERKAELEILVDGHGLPQVLAALRDICADKADHLRCNWQDEHAALQWEKVGELFDKLGGVVDDVLKG